jgi:N-methylhydantoinase A
MEYRISVDTGGTFTDVIVADDAGGQTVGKSLTTPDRIWNGMRGAMENAAELLKISFPELLRDTEILIYGTTRSTNAIVQNKVAKTAFLTTEGFPDTLVLKEGGKFRPHDLNMVYPEPYIPRSHTFEITERMSSEGDASVPFDTAQAQQILERLKARNFEAVAVCFLWSITNPEHELAMADLLDKHLPGVPYTLSHQLAPIIREYRRASATAIDASLKPLMQEHLREMNRDLREAGYEGEILVSTSVGGCLHVDELVERPIHTVKCGPAMAPVAGLTYAQMENLGQDVIICDTGGTTFDVGLVRDGQLKFTRETWLGGQYTGHLLGISSVDVRSIGAGGGSIAWIDSGGLMRVGPHSAGADPGPACYGKGGDEPTVTDAATVLGYLDPDYFLGGRMDLDVDAARRVVGRIADQIGQSVEETAFSICNLANELMIKAIHEITVSEGFDPRESALVAGGGAAGLNIMPIAREVGCDKIILPKVAGALSASGMQFSDIVTERSTSSVTLSDSFNFDGVNEALLKIEEDLTDFAKGLEGEGRDNFKIEFFVEARYQSQVWELDVPLPLERFRNQKDVDTLVEAFHQVHDRVFAVRDEGSLVECINWKGLLTVYLESPETQNAGDVTAVPGEPYTTRTAYFGEGGVETPIYRGLPTGAEISGPAIIQEPTTTIVVYPGMSARVTGSDNFILEL